MLFMAQRMDTVLSLCPLHLNMSKEIPNAASKEIPQKFALKSNLHVPCGQIVK
jgi:hypothetical protein